MAFPPGFLDELRNRISLSGLIGRRVKLVRRGREFAGLCPFHHEKTPSFYVVEDKSFFHCFGCGAHGDVIGFAMRADNLDFIEAVEKLAGEAGLAIPQATPQERERAQRQKTLLEATEAAAAFYEERLWAPVGARAREYLQGRGLDPETIRRFRLGSAPEDRQALRRALNGRIFRSAADRGRAAAPTGGGGTLGLFPQPPDVSDQRPRRPGHRLWRPGSRRWAAQISELAGQPALRKRTGIVRLVGGSGSCHPR